MSSQATAGPEKLVNTFTDNNQRQASVTALADGGWVVTWESAAQEPGGTGGDYGVYQQRYNAGGGTAGAESHVNSYLANSQLASSVAALADGGWLVTWTSIGQDGSGDGIYQRRFSADGSRTETEVRVNSKTAGNQHDSSVTALVDGGWLATWTSDGQDGSGSGVYQQRYGSGGGKVGAELRVNATTAGDQDASTATALGDGGWVVTWTSGAQDGDDDGVYQQRYDAAGGKMGSETRVNTTTADNQSHTAVAALADGGWVVTWASEQDGQFNGIYQQHFEADGSRIGSETRVNTTTIDDQNEASVTALADGGWVVTWTCDVGTTSRLYQQRYNADGGTIGAETLISSTDAVYPNILSSVTGLADGGWIVAWQSSNGNNYDIHQRHFAIDIRGGTQGDVLEGTDWDETLIGFAGNDTLDGKGGKDILIGGVGSDTYIVDSAGDTIQEMAAQGIDTVRSSVSYSLAAFGSVENLILTSSGNTDGTGNALANVITGTSGKNVLNGGVEGGDIIDTLNGGAGNDTYVLGSGHDKVVDSSGTDTITSTSHRSLADYATIENLVLLGDGSLNGTGNGLANVITGTSGKNILNGGADNPDSVDTLIGGAGDDTYVLGDGYDFIVDSAGVDTVTSTISRGLSGTLSIENLTLLGSDNINASGNELSNVIKGNSGNNILNGGPDSLLDTLMGGAGDDTYVLGSTFDKVVDTSGTDTITATISQYLANYATVENLTLLGSLDIDGVGNALANRLTGTSGDNMLSGDAGEDVLIGGAGADRLTGGSGADTFLFTSAADSTLAAAGRDTILDFSRALGDKVSLSAIDANASTAGDQAFVFIGAAAFSGAKGELRFDKQASDTYVYGDVDGDMVADLALHFDDAITLQGNDFVL